MHDAVGGGRPAPDGVLQVAPDARQDHLEHGEPAAQPLLGQQVPLPGDGDLLRTGTATGTLVRMGPYTLHLHLLGFNAARSLPSLWEPRPYL